MESVKWDGDEVDELARIGAVGSGRFQSRNDKQFASTSGNAT